MKIEKKTKAPKPTEKQKKARAPKVSNKIKKERTIKTQKPENKDRTATTSRSAKRTSFPKVPKLPNVSKKTNASQQKKSISNPLKHFSLRRTKSDSNIAKQVKPLNLKMQIIVGFIIPIFIVIFVGVSAYNQAEEGLIETYEGATFTSIEMASQLIDFGLDGILSNAGEIANNASFLTYASNTSALTDKTTINTAIMTKQMGSDFIENIHIIPKSESSCLSTKNISAISGTEIYDEVRSQLEEQCSTNDNSQKWCSYHSNLDEIYGLDSEKYFGAACHKAAFKDTMIIIDISKEKLLEILSQISLGENSILTYHTKEGRELTVGSDSFTFSDKEYAQAAFSSESTSGKSYVTEDGTEYLYMYSKCLSNGAMISAIVPKSIITAQADVIKETVILYVVIACIIVGIIGLLILVGLERNMRTITTGLSKASKGDLTVKLGLTGKSEFAVLSKHVMETIQNTKNLIASVQDTTQDVSLSSEHVGQVSEVIHTSVEAISDALEEINNGVSQEAEDAEECLLKMDALSEKIIHTSDKISEVETLVDSTKQMVQNGSSSMEGLIDHSLATSKITTLVDEKVDKLIEHSMQIEQFVKNINDIADQTTLLSLNASIEAARAGEMGRGFTVVAEEIKKLSENSMQSAKAIENLVGEIRLMTNDTKAATLQSQEIVKNQQEMVEATKQMFIEMNQVIDHLMDNMIQVTKDIESMDVDRVDTLSAIQNISGVIEETLASTTLVSEKIKDQVATMDGLTDATSQLNENTTELNHAVGKFTV